jgi:hypothetical protein
VQDVSAQHPSTNQHGSRRAPALAVGAAAVLAAAVGFAITLAQHPKHVVLPPTPPPASFTPVTPTAPPAPVTVSAAGDRTVAVPAPYNHQPTLVAAESLGTDPFAIETLGVGNSQQRPLVKTIGNFRGLEAMDFDGSTPAATVQIFAGGNRWSITFSDPSAAPQFATSISVGGRSDAVLAYAGNTDTIVLTHTGPGTFTVNQYASLGPGSGLLVGNRLVDTAGNYTGSVPVGSGGYLVINSDGTWTLSGSSG